MNAGAVIDTAERQAAAEIAAKGMCGSCGKHPKAPGFEMCVPCRVNSRLPVSKEAIAEFRRTQIKPRHREGNTMGRNQKRHHCSCGFSHGWGTHMQQHLEANPDHHEVDGPVTGGGDTMPAQPDAKSPDLTKARTFITQPTVYCVTCTCDPAMDGGTPRPLPDACQGCYDGNNYTKAETPTQGEEGSTVLPEALVVSTYAVPPTSVSVSTGDYPSRGVPSLLDSIPPDRIATSTMPYRSELADALLIIVRASHEDPAIPECALNRLAELAKGGL